MSNMQAWDAERAQVRIRELERLPGALLPILHALLAFARAIACRLPAAPTTPHLHARISERMRPGVVYTTFHHGFTGANVVTPEFEDWATGCPEYKVTAVEVTLARKMSEWQEQYLETRKQTTQIQNKQIRTGAAGD
jgi:hypothetical protein